MIRNPNIPIEAVDQLARKSNFSDYGICQISCSGAFLIFKAYDPIHGASDNFFVDRSALQTWINSNDIRDFRDYDMSNELRCYRVNQTHIRMTFSWIHSLGVLSDFVGYYSSFTIAIVDIDAAVSGQVVKRLVYIGSRPIPSKVFVDQSAQQQIAAMPDRMRRSMLKFLRGAFRYESSHVILSTGGYRQCLHFQEMYGDGDTIKGSVLIAIDSKPCRDGVWRSFYRWNIHG